MRVSLIWCFSRYVLSTLFFNPPNQISLQPDSRVSRLLSPILGSFVSKTSFDSSTGNLLLGLGRLLFYVWSYSFVLANLWANRKLNTPS